MSRSRADTLLVERGLVESRAKAQALIMAGLVYSDTLRIDKAGQLLAEDAPLTLKGQDHPWVSRGGLKLAEGLDRFGIDPEGLVCLDVGASTGGFTDVLLSRGAAKVYAVDVGHGQLAWKLRQDPRVVVLERTNARHLTAAEIPEPVDLVVCDASFISLMTVLPAPLKLTRPGAHLVALIKPQFEVGKGRVGKGGVVRDPELHREVCETVSGWLGSLPDWSVIGIVESPIQEQLVSGIAQGRSIDPAALRQLIDRGPFLDREALDAKLIDRIGYYDEVTDAARERGGANSELLETADYLDAAGPPHRTGPTIAVIYGTGSIQRGSNGVDPLMGGTSMGSDDIADAFAEAAEDPDVRAILFRIDSGGGSAVASESIRRALVKAKLSGKPVVVSMGEAAASGGYWIAMNADKIVAHPGTLTGSVGVVAGKMVTADLWNRFGIEWGQITRGQNAGMWSSLSPYSESESKRLDTILDDIYGAFVRNIAEARKLPAASVRDIAKGRVWTGSQAKALGLVDELGDMDTALGFAREAAGLPRDADVTLEPFPKPEPQWLQALDLITGRSEARSVSAVLTEIHPLLRDLGALVRDPSRDTLKMPPTGLVR